MFIACGCIVEVKRKESDIMKKSTPLYKITVNILIAIWIHLAKWLCFGFFVCFVFFLSFKVAVTLIFFCFDEKLSHLWIQIQKKQLNFLRLSMGVDRKKTKIWVLTEQTEDWYLSRSTSNLCTACTAFINRKQTRFFCFVTTISLSWFQQRVTR